MFSAIEIAKQKVAELAEIERLKIRGTIDFGIVPVSEILDDPKKNLERKDLQLVRRAIANPELGQAFSQAIQSKVFSIAGKRFSIAPYILTINIDATDQEIIDFLLGTENPS